MMMNWFHDMFIVKRGENACDGWLADLTAQGRLAGTTVGHDFREGLQLLDSVEQMVLVNKNEWLRNKTLTERY